MVDRRSIFNPQARSCQALCCPPARQSSLPAPEPSSSSAEARDLGPRAGAADGRSRGASRVQGGGVPVHGYRDFRRQLQRLLEADGQHDCECRNKAVEPICSRRPGVTASAATKAEANEEEAEEEPLPGVPQAPYTGREDEDLPLQGGILLEALLRLRAWLLLRLSIASRHRAGVRRTEQRA